MNQQLETLKKTRTFLLESIKDLSAAQFNKIPEGFSNNIIWNLGHIVAAQYGICYVRAGVTPPDETIVNNYRSGTKPEGIADEAEIEKIKGLLLSSLERTDNDYKENVFANYTEWNTRYDKVISNVDDALGFLPFHDGLHMGTIAALRKLVK
ncbi:DinB family protein [Chitinophagaceae bacterium MMS25-I14]